MISDEQILAAACNMDWDQVILNGGPPCFHLEANGRFCGRAERWQGHASDHDYVSLAALLVGHRRAQAQPASAAQSMGGSSGKTEARRVAEHEAPSSGEPPAQSSAEQKWLDAACKELGYENWWIHEPTNRLFVERPSSDPGKITVATPVLIITVAAPAPAAEPVAWALLEDLNLVQLERMAVEKEASDEQRIPCFISVEWVQRAVAAWRNAAPQPAQADEGREIIADLVAIARGKTIPEYDWMKLERADAYLARTGGKEAK